MINLFDRLRDLSIPKKLTVIMLLNCTAALLLAAVVLMGYEVVSFRQAMARDLMVLADVLGQNTTAALSFADKGDATSALMTLRAEPHIIAAALYSKDGERFAEYARAGAGPEFPAGPADGHRFERDRLVLARPVVLNQKRIGTIYLQADLEGMYERLRLFAGILGLVLLGVFALTLALASRLQRVISKPILALADTAKGVWSRKDYSARAVKHGQDEIGQLTDAFNLMLAGTEERDQALHKLSRVVEQGADSVCITDPGGVIEYVNPAFERLTGYTAAESLGRKPNLMKSGRHDAAFYKNLWDTVLAGRTYHGVLINQRKNGELYHEEKSITPLKDANGHIIHLVATGHDITARIRAENDLIALNETLEQRVAERAAAAEQASRAKSEFLANMSHELRTPLNSVIGFANILLKNKGRTLRPDDLTFLSRILANGKHLLVLINQILDLSKIEAQKVELAISPTPLGDLVPDILAQFEGQLRGRDIRLRAELPPNLAPLETDADKLKQVLINLVGNALKFTERGSVTVRVEAAPRTHQPVRISVIDTGIGIPKAKQAAIFEAFQQADSSTERKYGGTGLGLTISKALSQLLGYRLEVSSEVGLGSTFSLVLRPGEEAVAGPAPAGVSVLPAVEPSGLVPAKALPKDETSRFQDKLVLVIDDEADSRLLLSHLVEECGCRVITADSGAEALRRAAEVRPDLILLDLMMPNMNGWQVLNSIKNDPQLRDIPVVVASIVAGENRGTLLAAVDVLQKPVSREDIQRVLRACVRPKVLVVEDSDVDRRLMVYSLEAEGVELRTAANGREAMELLERFSPDIVLLDLLMPEMDGMTFLDKLRKDPRHVHLPVFIVTSKELSAEEKERLNAQAQRVLKKAGDLGADLERLLHELPRRAAAAERNRHE